MRTLDLFSDEGAAAVERMREQRKQQLCKDCGAVMIAGGCQACAVRLEREEADNDACALAICGAGPAPELEQPAQLKAGDVIKGGFWDGAQVLSVYTRAQALEDGSLVDVSETAREAGFKHPVAMTRAAWERCVAVPKGCAGLQDVRGRLWDVCWMLNRAIKSARDSDRIAFRLHVVQRRSDMNRTPPLVQLVARCGPGDDARPVITVMLPDED